MNDHDKEKIEAFLKEFPETINVVRQELRKEMKFSKLIGIVLIVFFLMAVSIIAYFYYNTDWSIFHP